MLALTTFAAATSISAAVTMAPPRYKATVLPQLDEHMGKNSLVFTWGYALNDRRTIVGSIGGTYEAFAWSLYSGAEFFQPKFAAESTPIGINNDGVIVGFYLPEVVFSERPFSYSPDGVFTTLPSYEEGLGAHAADINESGMIVGAAELEPGGPFGGPTIAVYWMNGVLHEIGGLGGFTADAIAVNDAGMVAGYANTQTEQAVQPFRWTEATGIEILPQLVNGVPSMPHDINDNGVIVGRGGVTLFQNEAVYWSPDGAIHELPRLRQTSDIGVNAVNNDGVMVGQEMGMGGQPEARLWLNNEVYHLADLVPGLHDRLTLLECTDVNELGVIIAHASATINGRIQHFTVMLTPVRAARPMK